MTGEVRSRSEEGRLEAVVTLVVRGPGGNDRKR